jgi:NitT/TauT family transport system substrate-binding protein
MNCRRVSPRTRRFTPVDDWMEGVMTGISRRTFVTATGLAAAGAALAACSDDKKSKDSGSSNKTLDKVTYLTGFGILGRESYIHVAMKKGFMADAGIEVTVQPGQAGDYNAAQVVSRTAQFAAIDCAGQLIRVAKADKPEIRSLRIISAVNQLTLNAVMTWADKGIASPRDLQGKTIGVGIGAAPKTLFPAYARLAGVDDKQVKWQEIAPPQLPSLLITNKVDAIATFHPGAAAIEKTAGGRKMIIFPYGDYLSDLYGTVLITHADLIKENPDLVKRFNGALMRGLKYAVENPKEAGEILNGYDATQNVDLSSNELNIVKPYCLTSGGVPVGHFDYPRMAKNIAVLQGLGLMPPGLTPEQASDTSFLPKSDS